MKMNLTRRNFIQTAAISASAVMVPAISLPSEKRNESKTITLNKNPLKLGLMTYQVGMKWNIETIIKNLTEAKYEHVELRTTHAHGVEVTLSPAERAAVKKRFQDAGLAISLASGYRYNSKDAAVLKKNIEGTKEYVLLAHDVGALGVRVFGDNANDDAMLNQIGESLAEVGEFAHQNGVQIRVCDDGPSLAMIKKNIDASKCPYVTVNWNCPMSDTEGEGFEANFNSVKGRIGNIHLRDLYNEYPWRLFFSLLSKSGYTGYCDAEIPAFEGDAIRSLKYYRSLFLALQNAI
ncbi:MAG TPA: TIM barrel protein [Bacteroidales bacterium]|nr:TIM barrel protein [Bacteroidales bacterium]